MKSGLKEIFFVGKYQRSEGVGEGNGLPNFLAKWMMLHISRLVHLTLTQRNIEKERQVGCHRDPHSCFVDFRNVGRLFHNHVKWIGWIWIWIRINGKPNSNYFNPPTELPSLDSLTRTLTRRFWAQGPDTQNYFVLTRSDFGLNRRVAAQLKSSSHSWWFKTILRRWCEAFTKSQVGLQEVFSHKKETQLGTGFGGLNCLSLGCKSPTAAQLKLNLAVFVFFPLPISFESGSK